MSTVRAEVRDGLGAVERGDRQHFATDVRDAFADSVNLDAALKVSHPAEPRWDYLLGHASGGAVVGLEVHPAHDREVGAIIDKKAAAQRQLSGHLVPGRRVARWLWVASGKADFARTEKTVFRLAQNGIEFVGRSVLRRHLPPDKD
ncbi:MAG: hypothetical protein KC620_05370, partial [Myxococcales bacterium]|nr:hypothetical protein [Myxococcales bacterium]